MKENEDILRQRKMKRISQQKTHAKKMSKGSYLNRKETRRTCRTSERKKGHCKDTVNTTDFPSPLEFSTLCLVVEAKIVTWSDMILRVCRRTV